MDRKKSSYFRFYRTAFILVIFCVMFIGFTMLMLCSKLYKDEKFYELEAVSSLFIDDIKEEFQQTNTMYSGNITRLHDGFIKNYNISIYVYDGDGNCLLAPANQTQNKLAPSLMEKLDKDSYLDFDAHDVSEKEPSVLYGEKFFVRYGEGEPQKMYLASYSSTDSLNLFNFKLMAAYILSCAFCITIARLILKKQQKKYDMTAENFLRVCKQYSKGDFSEKINITTPGNLQETSKYVNLMASNMEKSDETSKTFIANVSHELRTPMTTIGGFVDGILDGTIPKSRQQEYLILVSKEIKRLRILISSMLNITKYESGTLKPNFSKTNLTDLVIQTVLMFEKKIDEKNLEIEGLDSDRLVAEVDSDLIQQVVYNLVENATKFVNKNGTISFRFEKADGNCIIGIKNTGEGLKNDEIQQVFDRFYKTDSSRGKDTTGLGLGLSISRKIVHLHNGHIIVRSVYGEYTEFAVQLPEKQNEQN